MTKYNAWKIILLQQFLYSIKYVIKRKANGALQYKHVHPDKTEPKSKHARLSTKINGHMLKDFVESDNVQSNVDSSANKTQKRDYTPIQKADTECLSNTNNFSIIALDEHNTNSHDFMNNSDIIELSNLKNVENGNGNNNGIEHPFDICSDVLSEYTSVTTKDNNFDLQEYLESAIKNLISEKNKSTQDKPSSIYDPISELFPETLDQSMHEKSRTMVAENMVKKIEPEIPANTETNNDSINLLGNLKGIFTSRVSESNLCNNETQNINSNTYKNSECIANQENYPQYDLSEMTDCYSAGSEIPADVLFEDNPYGIVAKSPVYDTQNYEHQYSLFEDVVCSESICDHDNSKATTNPVSENDYLNFDSLALDTSKQIKVPKSDTNNSSDTTANTKTQPILFDGIYNKNQENSKEKRQSDTLSSKFKDYKKTHILNNNNNRKTSKVAKKNTFLKDEEKFKNIEYHDSKKDSKANTFESRDINERLVTDKNKDEQINKISKNLKNIEVRKIEFELKRKLPPPMLNDNPIQTMNIESSLTTKTTCKHKFIIYDKKHFIKKRKIFSTKELLDVSCTIVKNKCKSNSECKSHKIDEYNIVSRYNNFRNVGRVDLIPNKSINLVLQSTYLNTIKILDSLKYENISEMCGYLGNCSFHKKDPINEYYGMFKNLSSIRTSDKIKLKFINTINRLPNTVKRPSEGSNINMNDIIDLIKCLNQKFDPEDAVQRYLKWIRDNLLEHNKNLDIHVLKQQLWGIHAFMAEFYFYLMWKYEKISEYTSEGDTKDDLLVAHLQQELKFLHEIIPKYNTILFCSFDNQKVSSSLLKSIKEHRKEILSYLTTFQPDNIATPLYYLIIEINHNDIQELIIKKNKLHKKYMAKKKNIPIKIRKNQKCHEFYITVNKTKVSQDLTISNSMLIYIFTMKTNDLKDLNLIVMDELSNQASTCLPTTLRSSYFRNAKFQMSFFVTMINTCDFLQRIRGGVELDTKALLIYAFENINFAVYVNSCESEPYQFKVFSRTGVMFFYCEYLRSFMWWF